MEVMNRSEYLNLDKKIIVWELEKSSSFLINLIFGIALFKIIIVFFIYNKISMQKGLCK